MANIYFCNIEKFEGLYEKGIELLPEKRREKTEKYIDEKNRMLSLTAGLMMNKVLGKEIYKEIKYNEHGKPFFEHGPFFSISHSGKYSVLAVSEEGIGIDIETRNRMNNAVAKRCFTADEQAFAENQPEGFIRIWEAKEAVLKLLGTGFSFSPKNFSVLPMEAEHEINGIKMRFFCGKINDFPIVAAYCGNENFEIYEFEPDELIQ